MMAPDHRNVAEQYCVMPQPFRMPFSNDVKAQPSMVDRGGQGLSFKTLDNPTRQELATHEAGHHHGHGGGCIQTH